MNDLTTTTTCNVTVDWATSERCGAPADHTWTGKDGDTYHECPDHSTHTSTRCPCGDVPEVEVGPYTIRHGSGAYGTHTITITETGKKIRTASTRRFLLIADGKIVARADTEAAIMKRSEMRDHTSRGLVVDMREAK